MTLVHIHDDKLQNWINGLEKKQGPLHEQLLDW
jgi:hypothetical protein